MRILSEYKLRDKSAYGLVLDNEGERLELQFKDYDNLYNFKMYLKQQEKQQENAEAGLSLDQLSRLTK